MATLEQIAAALKKADAAGNTDDAKRLADAYRAMQGQDGPPAGADPGSREYADWAASQARAGKPLPMVSGPAPTGPQMTGPADQIMAGTTSFYDALPIVGPSLKGGLEGLKAGLWGVPKEQISAEDTAREQQNPTASTVGGVTGTVLPFAVGGSIPAVAKVLGMSGEVGLVGNTVMSALSNAGISAADTAARGGDLGQSLESGGIGGALGAIIPGGGLLLKKGLGAVPKAANWAMGGLPSTIKAAVNPARAAQQTVGRAMAADSAAGLGMSAADEAGADAAGQSLINLDRGGPATRRAARVASAASPEAKAALEGAVDRPAPGLDTSQFLTNLVGGSADDVALRSQLEDAGRVANDFNYKRAYAAPAAQSVWTPEIQQLLSAPEMRDAIKVAEARGKTWAAMHGGKAVKNPFVIGDDGTVSMKQGVTPTLQFWDQVQRNLRGQAESFTRGGEDASRVGQLRQALNSALDRAVPEFGQARRGAAAFFGADNALDAGRQFAMQPRNLPEATKAFGAMSKADQKAFAIGAASSAIDKLKTGNTYAVVKQTFGNPAQKQFWQMVLGPGKAAQLEGYVKVQGLMEESKRAIQGGSHTFDLAVTGGLAGLGAAGTVAAPGNPLSGPAFFIAAMRTGRMAAGRMFDYKVGEQIAKLLASGDKAALQKIITSATLSPKWQAALDAMLAGTAAMSHAAVPAVAGAAVGQ